MRVKLFLVVMLSVSITCFAESESAQPEPLPAIDQVGDSVTGENERSARIKEKKKKNKSQPAQETGLNKRSLMIEYCRKHTC